MMKNHPGWFSIEPHDESRQWDRKIQFDPPGPGTGLIWVMVRGSP